MFFVFEVHVAFLGSAPLRFIHLVDIHQAILPSATTCSHYIRCFASDQYFGSIFLIQGKGFRWRGNFRTFPSGAETSFAGWSSESVPLMVSEISEAARKPFRNAEGAFSRSAEISDGQFLQSGRDRKRPRPISRWHFRHRQNQPQQPDLLFNQKSFRAVRNNFRYFGNAEVYTEGNFRARFRGPEVSAPQLRKAFLGGVGAFPGFSEWRGRVCK